ncbi:putative transcription factor GRAS family [Medicago truncatula]|uniref:GRAS family transcription factor n=1 Tax=Medicago truncatula TaxID=3880 RepID=G7LEV2_MEDTR|nr:scarecrow-like protein 15 [Medicago truncatula]AET03955.1 GRAS family transcription factor [Medicago truncatula]RHN42135.1 putative transcription factor GRAS family [Medicago truncatula]
MRVPPPAVSSSSSSPQPKLTTTQNIVVNVPTPNPTPTPTTTTLCYEPRSVLELCRSPSPEKKPSQQEQEHNPEVEQEDHASLPNLDWWDSIMKDLGLQDDSSTPIIPLLKNTNNTSEIYPNPSQDQFDQTQDFTSLSDIYSNNQNLAYNYPNTNTNLDHLVNDFNNNQPNNNTNSNWDFIEELIRAADCFDNNHLQLAQAILERLNQRLRSPTGKPLHRAAFHFKDALQSLLSGSNRTNPPRLSSMVEIVQTIRTFKAFSGISPIPMFSIFTTNQALLEALHGSLYMHVVDFEIGLGIQYASLMKEIAEKAVNGSPLLRITAVVPEEYAVESRLIRENLNQFAHDLGIRVQVDFVPLRTFETVSFKAVRFVDGEKTAILLTPAIFCRLGSEGTAAFLSDVRRITPGVVVFVDGEGWTEAAAAASFRRGVVNSLEFYSMMLESLDASVAAGGGGEWARRIEMLLLRPKIIAAVEAAGRRTTPWREAFYGAGMRPVQLSQFADFQAECLLAKVQIRGFHVAKRQAELVLFWHERAMVATSAWRC